MSPKRFDTFVSADPFEPFTIVKGDGEEVNVMSPKLVLVYPGGRTVHVVAPRFAGAKDEEDFEDHYIDIFLVTDIVKPVRRRGNRRRAG
jgi:hypothetical protein